jgi:orotate phosphoribosyltransferase
MIWDTETALKIAEFLLHIKAVRLSPDEPFTWASGWKSPIYCDNRLTLSYPDVRNNIRENFVRLIEDKYPNVDVIAGVATGGIALGVLVAQEMGLPFCYVRSSAKGHGMQNRVEGKIEPGQQAMVIEDLISTGGSSISAVEALRETGALVKGMAAIFTYGFPASDDALRANEISYHTLSDYNYLLEQALVSGQITEKELKTLQAWRIRPSTWNNNSIVS